MNSSNRGIPFIFHPVILFSGMVSGIVISIFYRMHITLFGIHQFSASSILITMLICLSVGSRQGGNQADKRSDLLVVFAVLQGILAIYLFLHPAIFRLLIRAYALVNVQFHPSAFGMGIIRILFSFVFLFIPLASIGAGLPVLSRYFTKHIMQAGEKFGFVLSSFSAGITIGLISAGFYLIPLAGMHRTIQFSALAAGILSGLTLIFLFSKIAKEHMNSPAIMSTRVRKAVMLFRKRKPVLEMTAKLTRAMIIVHAVQGFASASLLIVSFRIISAYSTLGLSYLHLLILSVYFAGLALGAIIYKRVTAGMANGYLLMASLEILTGFVILFSYLLFTITAPAMQDIARHSGGIWWKSVSCQLIACSSLLLFPALITGLLLPLAASIYPRRMQHAGRNIGRLGSLFLTGTLFGVIITHYIFLPLLGSFYSFFLLMMTALLSGIFLLFRDSRLIRGFRLSYTAISVACITGILFFMVRMGWINQGIINNSNPVISKQEGSSALVTIRDLKHGNKGLFIDGIDNQVNGITQEQQLPAIFSCAMNQAAQNALVIGFGTGIIASVLENCDIPSIRIAELYPEVLTLSANSFGEENQDILTSSRVDISIEDARYFLFRQSRPFDLITSGYTSQKNLPGFFTSGFYHSCYARLAKKGLLTQELPLRGVDKQEFRSLVRAAIDVFPEVTLWYLSTDKVLLMARKERMNPDYCLVESRFIKIDQNGRYSRNGIATAELLLGRQLMDDRQLRIFAEGAPENTDDRSYVEFSKTPPDFTDPELIRQLIKEADSFTKFQVIDAACTFDKQDVLSGINLAHKVVMDQLFSLVNPVRDLH
jgi:spermidine synthase